MKPDAWKHISQWRIREGELASDDSLGNNGAFMIRSPLGQTLGVVVSDGEGWDHVSVSLPKRCPLWSEMCFIKDLFFEPHEVAIQIHPPKSEYVNHHEFCLHLWRSQTRSVQLPPSIFVGPKK